MISPDPTIVPHDSTSLQFYLAFVTAALGAVAAATGWYVKERQKRSALRRMLFAEMCSFAAVLDSVGLVDAFTSLIEDPSGPASRWAGSASAEDYFSLFGANAANLGLLDPDVVSHVTACYSFMKGSRDLMRVLASWKDSGSSDEQRRTDVRDVARLVACSLEEAVEASRLLINEDSSLGGSAASRFPPDKVAKLARRFRALAAAEPDLVLILGETVP